MQVENCHDREPLVLILKEPVQHKSSVDERIGRVYYQVAYGFTVTCVSSLVSTKLGLAGSVISLCTGSVMGPLFLTAVAITLFLFTTHTSKENTILKQGLYTVFSAYEGIALSPLVLFNVKAFFAASTATVLLTGALGYSAMALKESFEKYEKILMVGLGAIALASFGSLVLPTAAAAFAHEVSLIGGLALFSALVILDTHKVRKQAHEDSFDEINHALGIYLDGMNLLIRIYTLIIRFQESRNSKKSRREGSIPAHA